MRRWTREEPDNQFCRSCTPLDPWFKTSKSQKMETYADGASGVAISTRRRPAPIELRFGGRVLRIIGKHAVKSVFAHLQYLAHEVPRACCSVQRADQRKRCFTGSLLDNQTDSGGRR